MSCRGSRVHAPTSGNHQREKRSASARLLDSLGPSLRYAIATVNKIHRSNSTPGWDGEPPFCLIAG